VTTAAGTPRSKKLDDNETPGGGGGGRWSRAGIATNPFGWLPARPRPSAASRQRERGRWRIELTASPPASRHRRHPEARGIGTPYRIRPALRPQGRLAGIAAALQLHTERLLLRPLEAADLPLFVAYRRDPAVARYQGWDADYQLRDAEHLLDAQRDVSFGDTGTWLQIAIVDRADGTLYGDCAVHVRTHWRATAEVGITLASAHQGQAIASEALTALIGALFRDLALHRVVAEVDDRNAAARRVFERLGFRLEARLVEADWFKGEWSTLCIYALLAREWHTG
jgi:RimJ/RimL family protein N-acetyltransferase